MSDLRSELTVIIVRHQAYYPDANALEIPCQCGAVSQISRGETHRIAHARHVADEAALVIERLIGEAK